jgi:Asp-tRNA(Asn)/Glu-tRNA(Gln) amidotransferase A subunit family amidase
MTRGAEDDNTFHLIETSIDRIQRAFKGGDLSARELTQLYLNRIEALDRAGPQINSIITVAPDALAEADRLDATLKTSGPVGPLHGVPVVLKDQMDA